MAQAITLRRVLCFMNKKIIEKWVLVPLNLLSIVLAILSLFDRDWVMVVVFVVTWFIIGGIGQSLHKDKTARQLSKGEHIDSLFK